MKLVGVFVFGNQRLPCRHRLNCSLLLKCETHFPSNVINDKLLQHFQLITQTWLQSILSFLPGRHFSLQKNTSRLTCRYTAKLYVLISWTAERKTTVARGQGFLSEVMKMGGKAHSSLRLDLSGLPRSGATKVRQYADRTAWGLLSIYPFMDLSTVSFHRQERESSMQELRSTIFSDLLLLYFVPGGDLRSGWLFHALLVFSLCNRC